MGCCTDLPALGVRRQTGLLRPKSEVSTAEMLITKESGIFPSKIFRGCFNNVLCVTTGQVLSQKLDGLYLIIFRRHETKFSGLIVSHVELLFIAVC